MLAHRKCNTGPEWLQLILQKKVRQCTTAPHRITVAYHFLISKQHLLSSAHRGGLKESKERTKIRQLLVL